MISMQNPSPQTTYVRDLPYTGMANGFPGRHVFRIDEKILPGVCIRCWLNIFNIRYSVLSFNMFLQLPNLWGTWSGPICRWCSPPRMGTCWGARWSTWQGLALSRAWGWPAGLMMMLKMVKVTQVMEMMMDMRHDGQPHRALLWAGHEGDLQVWL